ncbi:DUF2470 domain-containing protein [Nocardioides sp. AX2bis]|uniref:DUF2470 domain-containing protein n=1 Tax=Nocardioides sp. AX2bis TaxID=2653157 RepID=UPI0012EF4AC5|nr:DUF2470 domain-containing protein [Nocardioides sp. AX2bis]VXB97480.1 conserved hypothetical protein [Nocardioides sp. AX2bis]
MSPSYAERARAVVVTATGLEVGVLSMTVPVERHLADADGSLLICAPPTGSGEPGSPLALAGRFPGPVLTATLTDVAGVPEPDRVRGRVRLTGPLTRATDPLPAGVATHLGAGPGRPVLRLVPQRVAIDWRVGPEQEGWQGVDAADYTAAAPDPLAGWEAGWTAHLDRDHPDLAAALARSVRPDLDPAAVVRPVLVDRGGITLRVHHVPPRRVEDLHLPLGREVRCGCDARLALQELVEARLPPPR